MVCSDKILHIKVTFFTHVNIDTFKTRNLEELKFIKKNRTNKGGSEFYLFFHQMISKRIFKLNNFNDTASDHFNAILFNYAN